MLSNGSAWAGPATLVYGLALLSAAAVGAEGANERIAEQSFGWRQPVAALIALAAAAAPLLAAASWVSAAPTDRSSAATRVQVPAFVAEESGTRDQARTLVLDSDRGPRLLRPGPRLRRPPRRRRTRRGGRREPQLDEVVANLVAGSGADQAGRLAGYAVRYVLAARAPPAR